MKEKTQKVPFSLGSSPQSGQAHTACCSEFFRLGLTTLAAAEDFSETAAAEKPA
jgi:hypothetical protein